MNNIKKFAFCESLTFTLTGDSDYIGYYNTQDGVAYVGKYNQTIKLNDINTIQNVIARSDKFYNRLPGQNLTLTYTISDFIFQPSEFINSNSIDNKLSKAFNNFLDTYRFCFMASSDLPENYTRLAKLSATNNKTQFVWTSGSNNTLTMDISTYNTQFTTKSKIIYTTNKNSNNNNNTLIVANSGSLFVYTVNEPLSTFNLSFSSYFIDTGQLSSYGALKFNDITSLSRFNTTLYICDSGARTVYSYDIDSVVSEDRALGYKFFLKNSINNTQGGFITPTLVCSSKNIVYIYDKEQFTVFYYDTNFNLINSYKNEKLFSVSKPISITYYEIYNQVFILTEDFNIVALNAQGESIIYNLNMVGLLQNEVAKKIVFSNSNSDVFYLLSNKNLYKRFVSNMSGNIGQFSFVDNISGVNTQANGDLLYDIDTLSTNLSTDNLLVFGYNEFINYDETTIFNSLIK
jgi:hypothetical protein